MLTLKMRKILLLAVCFTAFNSCRTPGKAKVAEAGAAGEPGLDVNDVSILYPRPPSLDASSKMLALSLTLDNGKPLMSEDLFHDIIGHFAYTTEVEGETVKLNAGVAFRDLDRAKAQPNQAPGPFDNYADWHVVSVRYDACAPSPDHNLANKAQEDFKTTFDPAACLPQLRLVIQPVVSFFAGTGRDDKNTDAIYGDYTMHLLFTLTPDEARSAYNDLVQLRRICSDLTSGVPLGPHPCLRTEKAEGHYGDGPAFQAVRKLVQRYAHTYTGVSAMASKNDTDPWVFMNGTVQDDHYQHIPINAVQKTDNIKRNAKGRMLEPFSNGYYQMVSFLTIGGSVSDASPVTPVAVPSKVNISFSTEFRDSSDDPAFVNKLTKLENPRQNDFFSSDCVSCHGAAGLGLPALNDSPKNSDKTRGLNFDQITATLIRKDSEFAKSNGQGGMWDKIHDADYLQMGPGYSNTVDLTMLPHSDTDQVYAFMHFGFFQFQPAVSHRVTQESAKVAYEANHFYNGGAAPRNACSSTALRECLANVYLISAVLGVNSLPVDPDLLKLNACMVKVCKDRASELSRLFGSAVATRYQALQDIHLNRPDDDSPTQAPVIAAGTQFSAFAYSKSGYLNLVLMDAVDVKVLPSGPDSLVYGMVSLKGADQDQLMKKID